MDIDKDGMSPSLVGRYPRSLPVSPLGQAVGEQQHIAHLGGFTAPMPIPPEPSEKQKVMEAAVAAERMRARELEKEEEIMTADELRAVLKKERRRTSKMAADLASFKMVSHSLSSFVLSEKISRVQLILILLYAFVSLQAAVELQSEAEVIEEGRINGLMRRLDNMQQEKGRIILDLEREEEMVSKLCS